MDRTDIADYLQPLHLTDAQTVSLTQARDQLIDLMESCLLAENDYADQLSRVHPGWRSSALNLIHYRQLRRHDIRDLQQTLGRIGLSRLARAELHTMASIKTNLSILQAMLTQQPWQPPRSRFSVEESKATARQHAINLFGPASPHRDTRIMVTLPGIAAEQPELIEQLIDVGMNCARINCAHDNPTVWRAMISHIRQFAHEKQRPCRIAMDLAGPKIRTGALPQGPKVKKIRVPKDARGFIPKPLEIWLGDRPPAEYNRASIPMSKSELIKLQPNTRLYFEDARGKNRLIKVKIVKEDHAIATLNRTAYIEAGLPLFFSKKRNGPFVQAGDVPAVIPSILLQPGDSLYLYSDGRIGHFAGLNPDNGNIQPAGISCTTNRIFSQVIPGQPILFDDGKITGRIKHVTPKRIQIEIEHTPLGGGKLRPDKGINLPESKLDFDGLTEKDKSDLQFIAAHADLVNISFINKVSDVDQLIKLMDEYGIRGRLGIILKIETRDGYEQLTDILLAAMQLQPLGVMIARGDLAIETGWDKIGTIQKEIHALCVAAHVPDIWATQVLERMAKSGLPSRAEITDAVTAQRAECVMLNKGPYIVDAIRLLDHILTETDDHRDKNRPLTPVMS